MKRHLRLRHRNDFARLRTQGTTIHTPYFVLSYHPNELSHHRYALVASRRIGNAVQRNKVRRRLRETLFKFHPRIGRTHLQANGESAHYDLILIARQPINRATFQEIVQQLNDALQRAGLLEM